MYSIFFKAFIIQILIRKHIVYKVYRLIFFLIYYLGIYLGRFHLCMS